MIAVLRDWWARQSTLRYIDRHGRTWQCDWMTTWEWFEIPKEFL